MPTDVAEDDATRIIESVRLFDHDIRQAAGNIKVLKEQVAEVVEATEEFAVVESLKAQLKGAKEKLKYKLLGTARYNDLMGKMADYKDGKKSAEIDMSDYLVAYHANTKERQIEINDGDARDVIVKAKLGKAKDFQVSMFGEPKTS